MDAAPLSKEAPPAAVEGALPSPAKQAVERRPSPDDDATGVRASGGGAVSGAGASVRDVGEGDRD